MRLQSRENPGHLYSRGGEGSPSPALGKEGIYLTEVAGRLCRDLLTVLSGAAYRGKKRHSPLPGRFPFFFPSALRFRRAAAAKRLSQRPHPPLLPASSQHSPAPAPTTARCLLPASIAAAISNCKAKQLIGIWGR